MSIKITVTADICPAIREDIYVEEELLKGNGKNFIRPVLPLFEKSDLVIGNLETAITDSHTPIEKCGPNLAMKTATLKHLIDDMGFDAMTLANNHIFDHGLDGLRSTIEELDKMNVPHCGAALTHKEACKPMIFDIKGKSIAVFNFAESEYCQAQYNGPGTARIDPFFSQKRIMDIRDSFDYIIAILHVGNEHLPIPSPETINNCRSMAAAGADAVIGHHAHIPQMMEEYEGVPICYGLGNFLFGQKFNNKSNPGWHLCTVADLTLTDDGVKMKLVPFRQLEDLALHELGEKGKVIFADYFVECSRIFSSDELYRKIWEQEARSKFGGDIVERFASMAEAFDTDDRQKRIAQAKRFYNLFNCTTHRERMTTGLRLIYDGKEANDDQSQKIIDKLIVMLFEILNEE